MKPLTAAVVATAVALSIGVAGAQNGREIKQNGRTSGRTGGSSGRTTMTSTRTGASSRAIAASCGLTARPAGPVRSSRIASSSPAIGASFVRTFATAATTGAI